MSKIVNINSYRNTWKKVYTNQQGKTMICVSAANKTSELLITIGDKSSAGQSIKLSMTDAVGLLCALSEVFSEE